MTNNDQPQIGDFRKGINTMEEMTHRERIWASVKRKDVDRLPISLWRHFGGIDMTTEGLSDAMVGFQSEFDWDMVKFMPTGTYSIMDWGASTVWTPNMTGIREIVDSPIQQVGDWRKLEVLDTSKGVFGMVNAALADTIDRVGQDTPVLQTIFSPLSTARKLGGPNTIADIRRDPESVMQGLSVIEEVTRTLMADAVDRGADIFYVFQSGTADVLTEEEFGRFELSFASRLLSGLPKDTLTLLHSHGDHLWFDSLFELPVDGINWHDRSGGPSLAEARRKTEIGLVGGLEGLSLFRDGTVDDVNRTISDLQWGASEGIIAAPGCVIPVDSSPHLLRAARNAVTTIPTPA